MSKQFLYFM